MDTRKTIVVLGSVNMDLVLRLPRLPGAGETLFGRDFETLPGGKGANQAVAAARLGGAVSFIGCVGDDGFGREARAALQREGIDTTHLRTVDGTATGIAMIFVDDAGRNCIGLAAGANASLTLANVDAASGLIEGAALLLCQLESPLPVVCHAIGIAHRAGVPVLLNPAPAQELPAGLAAQVTWLIPNQSEAALLSGGAPGDGVERSLPLLAARGYRGVIVTLGEQGVCVGDDSAEGGGTGAGARRFPAFAADAVDTTGAGDTFNAGLAVGLREGMAIDAAIRFAQRAAAIGVTRAGAMASMPTRVEVDAAAGAPA